ncbi:MAG: hypothetical protein ACJ8R9_25205 [Steroidobacteraceae bacterium]
MTYVSGFTTVGNCSNNRLEIRESGDYYGNLENNKRLFALVLTAQATGKPMQLIYNDTDGPGCRLEGVLVQW